MDRIFIVAEIGVNHNGDVEMGKRLIEAAARVGADAVKTQLFVADQMTSVNARKAAYQIKATGNSYGSGRGSRGRGGVSGGGGIGGSEGSGIGEDGSSDSGISECGEESQLEMLKKLELSADQYILLSEHAKHIGITLFAAPFDLSSVKTLQQLSCPIYKIPSGEITNLPLLLAIARTGAKKVLLSTGMSTIDDIQAAIKVLTSSTPALPLTLLHCHTQYPTDYADANLRAMETMRTATGLPVGFSDHTPGIEVAIAAAALGAVVIEKHFTLDKTLPGPDHVASLEPDEFALMVRSIRNVENALGSGDKTPTRAEAENMIIARKSIVAARRIYAGEVFGEDMLAAKRPGGGISPMQWYDVIGKTAARDFVTDEQIDIP